MGPLKSLALNSALAICCASFGLAQTEEVHYPAGSVWVLDAAASDLGGFPSLKADTFAVDEDTAAMFRWHDRTLLGDGRTVTSRYSHPEDGQPHLLDGGRDESIAFWPDGRSFWQYPDGTTVRAQTSFSNDGETNTFAGTARDAGGHEKPFRLVYRRARGASALPAR